MVLLPLHETHALRGARFDEIRGFEAVADYGDAAAEHAALRGAAAVIDLSFRGRFCVAGPDRVRLLNGQTTQDVKALGVGTGRRAAFCGPKGRLIADAHIYALADELLVDVEPGLTETLIRRLEHHIVAEDVQVVDAAPHYGLLSIQGPRALQATERLGLPGSPPQAEGDVVTLPQPEGDLYVVRNARLGRPGVDLYAPVGSLDPLWDRAAAAVAAEGGRPAGFGPWETARFEAGIPRFGIEIDETNLAPETGLERDAISYSKGCYTGQETIARLRTYGQVSKALRGLRLSGPDGLLPDRGAAVRAGGKPAGAVVSALASPAYKTRLAMAYLRREFNAPGGEVQVTLPDGSEETARVLQLPFSESSVAGG